MLQTKTQHTPVEEQQPPTRINPRIILLSLGMFALGTDAFVVAGVLPVIAKETGVTEGIAGQLITIFALTYGLGAPLLAALTGRWPRNSVLIGALGLFCLANLASALSPSFPLLLLTRILAGCFAATYAPMAYTIGISLAPPAKRGQALALVVMGLTVATALGAPLGTWIGEAFGWRFSFAMVAILGGIAFLFLVICGLPRSSAPEPLSLKQRLMPITHPRVMRVLAPALLWNIGTYICYAYIASLLQQNMHIEDVSILLVFFGLGMFIGSYAGGLLVDRFSPPLLLQIFLISLLLTQLFIPLLTTTIIGGAIILLLWALSFGLLFIPQQRRLLNTVPEHANVILALNNATIQIGIAGGAAVGGLALRFVTFTQLAWVGTGFILLSLLILMLNLRQSKGQPQAIDKRQEKQEHMELRPE